MLMKTRKIPIKSIILVVALIIVFPIVILLFPTIQKTVLTNIPPISFVQTEYSNDLKESTGFKMLFVGDVMLARTIGDSIVAGNDPFINLKDKFKEYNLIVANLETVVSENQYAFQNPNKLFTFNSPVSALDTLTNNRIEIVSLANNHTMDYGAAALVNTMENLKARGILFAGAGNNTQEAYAPKYIYYNKTRIALLAFNDIENWVADVSDTSAGSAYFDKELIKNSLIEASANADIIIVFPHWGVEYSLTNSERQAEYGRFFVDNGADIVIGSHPHVLQNSEEYNGVQIYYSLGNFVFDDMCTIPNACDAGMVELNVSENKIINSNLIKVKLGDNGFPELE